MSYLRYMSIVVPNTYCIVFLFCLSSSCVPYAAGFSGLSIFDYLFQGRIQDFKLGGAHLKKLPRAEGGAKFLGYFV
jgi:hypothetical protein